MAIVPRQSYGIKLAAPGYDVNTAPDYQLLFNSSWPSMAIGFEVSLTRAELIAYPVTTIAASDPTDPDRYFYTIPHNLGFYPLLLIYIGSNNVGYGRYGASPIYFDKTNIYYETGYGGEDSYRYNIVCVNIDITVNKTYPAPETGTDKVVVSPNFGLKVAKVAKDIKSTDLRDFIIHSRAQSPAVYQVITSGASELYDVASGTFTIPLTTTYIPWFALITADSSLVNSNGDTIYYTQSNRYVTFSNNSLVHRAYSGGSVVLMRDPLFPPTNVSITY